jgi:hypothetical protein
MVLAMLYKLVITDWATLIFIGCKLKFTFSLIVVYYHALENAWLKQTPSNVS